MDSGVYYIGKLEGKVGCGISRFCWFAYTGVCVLIWCWTILHFAVGAAAHIVYHFAIPSQIVDSIWKPRCSISAASYIGGIAGGGGLSIAGAAYQGDV